jgi:Fe-S oxidoreductase/FAD/FMN-containing dehydrogenase
MHVASLDVLLADGTLVKVGAEHNTLEKQIILVEDLVSLNSLEIAERFPEGLLKRWPGYGLTRAAEAPRDLIRILAGSEGTLAAIVAADLKIVPLPRQRGVGLIFFDSVREALAATKEILVLKPAAIEHIDRALFDQTRGQRNFQAVRDLLNLDHEECESILIVEFFDHAEAKLSDLESLDLGTRNLILQSSEEVELVWAMRKAGLSLLTSRKGDAKPACFVEDAAVRPQDLAAYFDALEDMMNRAGVEASYYGHAAAGLLHVRPILDLRHAEDLRKYRQIANEIAALVRQFKGSLAGEHGVGIARTEFLREQVGDELYRVMWEIKRSFDPGNLFNPGKIIDDGRYKIDSHLRHGPGYEIKIPFTPQTAFHARDGSFLANLEQCNGCGGCLKQTPSMCPTYLVTGEEYMSTRGRANAIRAALELREIQDPLKSAELDAALSNCLSCRACTQECPSNVNLPLLKAELLQARLQIDGLSRREKILSSLDWYGKKGSQFPGLANFVMGLGFAQRFTKRMLGFAPERPLPSFAKTRFDHWFKKHKPKYQSQRGQVILWDDTFTRYYEPHIGVAAVEVLENAGYQVLLPQKRECCGRPAFSQGNLKQAALFGQHNLSLLAAQPDLPILFLEPSCYSMFKEDYRELNIPGAAEIAARSFLFEEFIDALLQREPDALAFDEETVRVAVHVHCHTKALGDAACAARLIGRLPNRTVTRLETGCCGMAGAFGMQESKYALSLKVAEPLLAQVNQQPYGTIIIASGTSCRQQIQHLSKAWTRHIACVLADALPLEADTIAKK